MHKSFIVNFLGNLRLVYCPSSSRLPTITMNPLFFGTIKRRMERSFIVKVADQNDFVICSHFTFAGNDFSGVSKNLQVY